MEDKIENIDIDQNVNNELSLSDDEEINHEQNASDEKNVSQESITKNNESLNEPVKSSDVKENYLGYYLFVFISAIIGFIAVYILTRFAFYKYELQNNTILHKQKFLIAVFLALVAVILFMFISLSFKKFLKKIYLSETFLYLYIGFLTTVINVLAFRFIDDMLIKSNVQANLSWKLAEIIAFIISVIFAFFADKIIVFKSFSFIPITVFTEFSKFVGARLLTEFINFTLMFVLIEKIKVNQLVSKIFASVIVIILNYIFGKFIIFKKKSDV